MKDLFFNNPYFGFIISLLSFEIGKRIFLKLKNPIFNPLLIAIILVIGFLYAFDIPLSQYELGGNIIGFFLAPATVALGLPLYKQFDTLKKNFIPIFLGSVIGSFTAIGSVILLGKALGIEKILLISFMPKSITTPIGIEVSKLLGGLPSITVFAIIVTGVSGNIFAPLVCNALKIKHPVAKGLGIGVSSHAVGTAKAMEMGEVEGAMSALSIVVAGIITIFLAPLLVRFI
ncbi:MAG: LrgB family protein [Cetobacterium sp.]|uniref:TIGR00659 family protein n=1 Tax=Cetobacterium ceti TaxID=180163 RepID=A0A1T4KLW8_9FUSO|nr:LrgB family protein [Cetobacterium ceti]MCJ8341738.1 LrgB family protein [Cetobacterium sp.]SJZ43432.1 TIGR00659 family protein [Cetobacterium ceti]